MIEICYARFVTIERASAVTGYSEDAIRTKINRGMWIEGREWKWAEDGRLLIDIDGYNEWAKRPGKASMRGKRRYSSISAGPERATAKHSNSNQPQKI